MESYISVSANIMGLCFKKIQILVLRAPPQTSPNINNMHHGVSNFSKDSTAFNDTLVFYSRF